MFSSCGFFILAALLELIVKLVEPEDILIYALERNWNDNEYEVFQETSGESKVSSEPGIDETDAAVASSCQFTLNFKMINHNVLKQIYPICLCLQNVNSHHTLHSACVVAAPTKLFKLP